MPHTYAIPDWANDPDDDHGGLAAWVGDDGTFYAVGGDDVARAYGDGDAEEARLQADLAREPAFAALDLAGYEVADLSAHVARWRAKGRAPAEPAAPRSDDTMEGRLLVICALALSGWILFGVLWQVSAAVLRAVR